MTRFAAAALVSLLGIMSFGFVLMGGGGHDAHHGASTASQPCPVEAILRVICAADSASAALTGASGVSASMKVGVSLSNSLVGQPYSAAFSVLAVFALGTTARQRPREYRPSMERQLSWLSLFANSPSNA